MELAKEGKSAILFVVRLGLLGTVVLIAALVSGGRSDVAQAATVTIEVGDVWFCDSSFQGGVCETTIDVGDTVTWQWVGVLSHTSTECGDSLGTCPSPHLWESGTKTSGSFGFTFDSAGTFLYRCQIHPSVMRGAIVVLAADQPTPTPNFTSSPSVPPPTPSPMPSLSAPELTPAPAVVPAGGGMSPGTDGPQKKQLFMMAAGSVLLLAASLLTFASLRRWWL